MKYLFHLILGITLVLSLPAIASKSLPSSPELITKGKAAYQTNCAVCHGDRGDGNGPAGASLNPKARNFITDNYKAGSKPEQVFKTISEGLKNTAMAGFSYIPEEDRWGITYYILSLKKK
jgi:mono/diheme cytochrome c family protein